MSKKVIVAHLTDNNDLYHEEFASKEEAQTFMDENVLCQDQKAIMFVIESESEVTITVHDRT